MGAFVAFGDFGKPSLVLKDPAISELLNKKMERAVEGAKRLGAKWILVVPGLFQPGSDMPTQTANVIENLKRCAGVLEPSGTIMVIEPLNPRDHPGMFLTKISQAHQICKAVASPSCKIIEDIYHQQITEGDLMPNMDKAWDEIAYFHLGDTPGRKEPTTGEINYRNIFKHIHAKGYQGLLGMEHGNSKPGKAGEQALIEAYRWCDDF
jgi:hydroxypyruvate isomerase